MTDLNAVFLELTGAQAMHIIKDVALSYGRELGAQEQHIVNTWRKYDKESTGKLSKESFLNFAKEIRPISDDSGMKALPTSSIFALFVLAGFPEVLSIGCKVKYTENGAEMKDGVVLKHFPEKDQTLIVDMKNRKRRTIKDDFVEVSSVDIPALDCEHVSTFIEVISDITLKLKAGYKLSVESVWVLALSMKALLRTIESGGSIPQLYTMHFVQCVVHLASQSTGFSKHWLLKDLEILSLMLYTREKEEDGGGAGAGSKEPPGSSDPSSTGAGASATGSTGVDSTNPWSGLDDAAKVCFQTLTDHLDIPVSILRAIYEMKNRSCPMLLMEVHDCIDGDVFTPSEAVKKAAKKYEQGTSGRSAGSMSAERAMVAMDTGMQVVLLPKQVKRSYEKATEEATEEAQKLILHQGGEFQNEAQKQRRGQSSKLLKQELESQGHSRSREFLVKVNMALAVLYGRQMLLRLLGNWPSDGPRITTELLGCAESVHLPFVLDLLNKNESKVDFEKVVENIIRHSEATCLGPLTKMACQFMEEVNLQTIVKESEHNYKNNTNYEDRIHIPGASFLTVKFDTRCCTEEECDELILSSSLDYQQDKKVFSGPRSHWQDFEMPGDSIFMKFTSDCSSNDWGYKFTVTGGKLGRFETGYLIINAVFSMPDEGVRRSLPVKELWEGLVYVACKQTAQQRLKSLQLMLKILQSQFSAQGCQKLEIDLSLLLPLWKLYNNMAEVKGHEEVGGATSTTSSHTTIVSQLCRALTELFLTAENLAMDWGCVRQYLASLMLKEDVEGLIRQGLANVAAVSLSIGYSNVVTEGIKRDGAKSSDVRL